MHREFRVLHLEDNPVNALLIRTMLEAVDSPAFQITQSDNLVKALNLLASTTFDAALIDLNLPDSTGIETFLAIHRNAPDLPVVVLSGCDSTALAMQAVECGAQDYLPKENLRRNELARALQYGSIRSRKLSDGQRTRAPQAAGLVGFLGTKGGVGVTTLVCHTARELKRQTGERILVMGFDMNAAGVAYLMKAPSQYTLVDASQGLHRLDAELWKGLVHTTGDGIDVLAPPGAATFVGPLDQARIQPVMRFARGIYDRIVLDLGVLNPVSLSLLGEVNPLYVVTNEDLPSLWEAGRLLARLTKIGVSEERLRFVLNQKKRSSGLSSADLEKALGHPIHIAVQANWEEESELLASGRFVDERSKVHKDITQMVAVLLGKPAGPKARTSFRLARLIGG